MYGSGMDPTADARDRTLLMAGHAILAGLYLGLCVFAATELIRGEPEPRDELLSGPGFVAAFAVMVGVCAHQALSLRSGRRRVATLVLAALMLPLLPCATVLGAGTLFVLLRRQPPSA